MNFSFGGPAARSPSQPRTSSAPHRAGTIDMSLGPSAKGILNNTPKSDLDTEEGGPDWRNALAQWVAEHAYYPEQARNNNEEGDVTVHVRADHDGRVREVQLTRKSGSMWLDIALVAMFRNAHIPRLPPGDDEPIDFNFTMRYILIRPPGY
jgi:protein TonB